MNKFDVAVIGSGPGGYVAAIRCAQLGFKTAIIERYPALGGTCLNVGCIPSKALLDSSEHFYNATHNFKQHGIQVGDLKVNLKQLIQRKDDVVSQTSGGVKSLMAKNKITVFYGHASFLSSTTIEISGENKSEISAEKIIIASGSKPSTLPNVVIDKKNIITSTEALKLENIPQHLIIIGGGVIGLELGSVYARLGSKISVIEYMDILVSTMDKSLSRELEKVLKKIGFEFHFGKKVTGAKVKGKKVIVTAGDTKDEKADAINFEGDYCLVSIGRKPYTGQLNLEKAGVEKDDKGRVIVNDHLQTSAENIYAIGDVVRGAMLAHKAEDEGMFVAEHMAGQKPHINYLAIPNVIYTWPEVASVGYTEEELKNKKIKYKTGSFPFRASGRARASMDTDGFIRVYADAETDELLGVHMIGPRAADMIAEAALALEFRASAEDIARICHAHPTYAESFREACLAATENRAIHI